MQSTQKPCGNLKFLPIPKTTCTHISIYFLALPEVIQLSIGTKFDHLLVIVDRYDKYSLCIAMPDNYSTTIVINAYYQYVKQHFELLEDIVSGQDTLFISFQWLQFCRTQHINQSISTANHPQTDCQTEVAINDILSILRAKLDHKG